MTMNVEVWDRNYEVDVYQRSKSVWIAIGDYMGQSVEVKGSSASSAVAHWKEAARYMGNLGPAPKTTS